MDYDNTVFGMFGGRENYEKGIEALVDFAQIDPGEQVLEVCCGTGISTRIVLKHTDQVTAVELNRERMERAQRELPKSVRLVTTNALKLQPKDGMKYDVILCINGFHYFDDPQRPDAVPEHFYAMAKRMLTPHGRLVFNVKLRDYNGVKPMHTELGKAAQRIVTSIRRFGENSMYVHDRGFLETAYTPENFCVGYPFRITRQTVFPLFLENPYPLVNYWANVFFETRTEEVMYENQMVTRKTTEYIWFDERLHQHIESIPKEQQLLKAELLVEARVDRG